MPKFKKKPVIGVMQFTDDISPKLMIRNFMRMSVTGKMNVTGSLQRIIIKSFKGEMTPMKGDWVLE
uniref:Uncharacterized protein n=1 Tax=viral metagenome TaxID=1070528 RepID=A0A6M3IHS0_9ZZZZ